MRLTLLVLILLLLPAISYSQALTDKIAEGFIQSLLEVNEEIRNFVLPEELQLSERLSITYDDVKNKFLISYDIDPLVKSTIIKIRIHCSSNELQKGFLFYRRTPHLSNSFLHTRMETNRE